VFITDSFQLMRSVERREEQRKQITAKLAKVRQAIEQLESKKASAPSSDDKLRAKLARQDPKASAAQVSSPASIHTRFCWCPWCCADSHVWV
jgi:septal ring factor EnvC (AmiA/AmiB activator)